MNRRIPIFTIVLLGSVGSLIALFSAFHAFTIEGSVRPQLTLRSLEGSPLELNVPYGRPHVLVFFSMICPYCRLELAHLDRLHAQLGACDVFLLSVGPSEQLSTFVDSLHTKFPVVLMDPRDALLQMGVRNIPTIMLANERGLVQRVAVGARSFRDDSLMLSMFCREGAPEPSALQSSGGGWVADTFWRHPRRLIHTRELEQTSLSAR